MIPASVIEICESAFMFCRKLQRVVFSNNSRLQEIKSKAFSCCESIIKVRFPSSLKAIRRNSFCHCFRLERVVFPQNLQLKRIEGAFDETKIRNLHLPPSVKEIDDVCFGMRYLEEIYINGDYFKSNS